MRFRNHTPLITPNGPWLTSLNWDLCATASGEICTPFQHYVRQGQERAKPSLHSFTIFLRLPIELQNYILSFCDRKALWQVMRSSPSTRKEAAKLFWSNPAVRFVIDGPWLLSGGYPGITYSDLEACKCMRYLYVEFSHTSSNLGSEWLDGEQQHINFRDDVEGLASSYEEHQITEFWKTLRRRFPCAKDVVLGAEGIDESDAIVFEELIQMVGRCPDGISARLSRFCPDTPLTFRPVSRQLFQQTHADSSRFSLELTKASWSPQLVLPPIQKRSGPVGAYERWLHDGDLYNYIQNARKLLLIQAIEAYYLHTLQAACICPFPNCGRKFEEPGQWALHYVSSDDSMHVLGQPSPPCETLYAAFADHEIRLKLILDRHEEYLDTLRKAWGEEGSDQRYIATQEFLEQLRDDPLCARQKEPEESQIWFEYQLAMNDGWHNYPDMTTRQRWGVDMI